jgi:cell wall assembly regulator SMI1
VENDLAQLDQRIPPSYRAFLADHDGGRPVRDCFSFEQGGRAHEDRVHVFLGVAPVPSPGTNLIDTAANLWRRAPSGVLPIARDPVGNLICLDGRDGRDGPVLFWDHEYEGDPPDEANLYVIAPDLRTFLDGLYEDPDPPVVLPRKRRWRVFGR